jgi:ribonuclease VapC
MIAVDTSALMAILLDEADSEACMSVLESETTVFISVGTLTEALIVAERRGVNRALYDVTSKLAGMIEWE